MSQEYEHFRRRHHWKSDEGGEPDVEAHRFRRADDGTESDEPDVEAHRFK
jgi:hypothetical protein